MENLRRELHPDLPHLAAHLTILPPRPLHGTESSALQVLERICGDEEPFEVTLGDVETFVPVTPTIYIRVDAAAARMSELHSKLNTGTLGVQGGVALHSASHDRQDERRTACADGLSDRPRALDPLLGKPSHPAGKADLCARRRTRIAGSIWPPCSLAARLVSR